jgi:hypothetical protein
VDARVVLVYVGPWRSACWYILKWQTAFNTATSVRIQKYESGGRLNVKIHFLFSGDNSWIDALGAMKSGTVIDHGQNFMSVISLFDEVYTHRNCAKFWAYVGNKAETLCAKLCHFVQSHTSVNHFIFLNSARNGPVYVNVDNVREVGHYLFLKLLRYKFLFWPCHKSAYVIVTNVCSPLLTNWPMCPKLGTLELMSS